jgi:hypothetical protein
VDSTFCLRAVSPVTADPTVEAMAIPSVVIAAVGGGVVRREDEDERTYQAAVFGAEAGSDGRREPTTVLTHIRRSPGISHDGSMGSGGVKINITGLDTR